MALSPHKRYAIVYSSEADKIANYMPSNYKVAFTRPFADRGECTVIEGRDDSGWTLTDYVLPRLASGLYFGEEIDLSHPVMHSNQASPDGML